MATSSTQNNKKHCIKCDGNKTGGGLFTCDGCQQMFCGRHVSDHRQELGLQLEVAMQNYDLIQQELSQVQPNQRILEKIDAWEKQSIQKIHELAETNRTEFYKWHQNTNDQIKKESNALGNNLRVARETDDFSEPDLTKWYQLLNNLRTKLESMTKVDIIVDTRACVNGIKILDDIPRSMNIPLGEYASSRATTILDKNRSRVRASHNQNIDFSSSSQYMQSTRNVIDKDRAKSSECSHQ